MLDRVTEIDAQLATLTIERNDLIGRISEHDANIAPVNLNALVGDPDSQESSETAHTIAIFALTPQANRIETAIEISRDEVRACTTRSKKGYNFDQMATILSRFAIARLVPVDGIRYTHGTGYVHAKGNYKTAAKFLVTMGEKKTVLELARAVNCQNSTYTGECYTLMEALYPCYETHQCKPNQIKWLSGHNYGMIASNTPSADTDQYWLPLFLLFTSCL